MIKDGINAYRSATSFPPCSSFLNQTKFDSAASRQRKRHGGRSNTRHFLFFSQLAKVNNIVYVY